MPYRLFFLLMMALAAVAMTPAAFAQDDDVCRTVEVERKIVLRKAELAVEAGKLERAKAVLADDKLRRDELKAREPSAATKLAAWANQLDADQRAVDRISYKVSDIEAEIRRLEALPPCPKTGGSTGSSERKCRTPQDEADALRMKAEADEADREAEGMRKEGRQVGAAISDYEAVSKKAGGFIATRDELKARLAELAARYQQLKDAAAQLRAVAEALMALPRCGTSAACPAAGPLQGGASDGPAAQSCKSAGPVQCEPKTQEKSK